MRYFNRKYKKQCATCKTFNDAKDGRPFSCPLGEILNNLEKENVSEQEVQEVLFNKYCDSFESIFYKPTMINEIKFEEFDYNIQKENMSKKVRVCHPEDENNTTFLGFNLGFLPVEPEIEKKDSNLKVFNNYDLAFYIPDLNIIVFNSEAIWFPLEDDEEMSQISDDEKKMFFQKREEIITYFFPNLFHDEIEKELVS